MTAQVASPSRFEGLDKVHGSRKSILANMASSTPARMRKTSVAQRATADVRVSASPMQDTQQGDLFEDSEFNTTLSKTDSLLHSRNGDSPAIGSLCRKSVQWPSVSSQALSTSLNSCPSPAPAFLSPPANGGYTGFTARNGKPHKAASVPALDALPTNSTGSASSANGNSSAHKLRRRLSSLSQNGSSKKDDDGASITSNISSHRDAISTFIRRARSRSSFQQPKSVPDSASISNASIERRRTLSGGARRISLKITGKSFRKKPESEANTNYLGDDDVPPVSSLLDSRNRAAGSTPFSGSLTAGSSIPKDYPTSFPTSSADRREPSSFKKQSKKVSAYTSQGESTPEAARKNKASAVTVYPRKANTAEQSTADEQQKPGHLGAGSAAVDSAGVFFGATAAALPSEVTRANADDGCQSKSDDDDDDGDVFHDAELADIHEDEEEGHNDDENQEGHKARKGAWFNEKFQNGAASVTTKFNNRSHELRETSVTAELCVSTQADADAGITAAEAAGAASVAGALAASSQAPSQAPSKLRGTSGAKRRAGSNPTPSSSGVAVAEEAGMTYWDAKSKKDVSGDVRDKAARVARLSFEDVEQTTDEMYEDIKVARGALHHFLNSRMIEAEEIIAEHANKRMYYALGYGLIATMKGFMTFESEDLAVAISYCKDSMHIAHLLRKQSNTVANLGRFVRGCGHEPSVIAGMTLVQRHAELAYAESLLLKAVLSIVYSGDFFGFVAEALNMRNAYGIYRSLGKYVKMADAKASGGRDKSIDEDFRSGVFLGNGLISLILGLLPGKILKVMDVFGYTGDTHTGLETLMEAGGWVQKGSQKKPKVSIEDEGIRRAVCDMGILLFHLVISVFVPVTGVDIQFADRVLHYYLDRYPRGVFFLYFSGRLYSTQALCEKAVKQYAAARDAQQEYVQLQHISWWDASLCYMSLAQWSKAREAFEVLLKESKWSKAIYSYGVAANMLQEDPQSKEAATLLGNVPALMQRIAGKSIPLEKFVACKAHKFNTQGRLLLPAIEFSYIYHCLSSAPRYALTEEQLVTISEALSELNRIEDPSQYHSGADEYWDDFCLAQFLRGVTLRYIAHPEPHAKVDPLQSEIPVEEAEEQALLSFNIVLEHAHKIAHDFWYIYFSHYELGRLHASMGKHNEAKRELELVLSGKMLEDKGNRSGKHKYLMQNMALLRSNGALNALDHK